MKNTLIITFLLGLTACAGGSGSSTTPLPQTPPTESKTLCEQSNLPGTWNGTVQGRPDIMTIDTSCEMTTTACSHRIPITFKTLNSDCSGNSASCGTGLFVVYATNNEPGCSQHLAAYNCSFSISADIKTLTYDCGGGTVIYTK